MIFFREIGVDLLTSNTDKTLLKVGKHLAGAEFCAPIESMYGHVKALNEKVDYIFLPVYIETRESQRLGKGITVTIPSLVHP